MSHIKERKTYQTYSDYLKKSLDPGRPACRRLKTPYKPEDPCCVPGSNQIEGDNIYCNPTLRTYDKFFNAGNYASAAAILNSLRLIKKNDPDVLELLRDENILAINC